MKKFFCEDVFLSGKSAKDLYESVKELPIIDYHCHLSSEAISKNLPVGDGGKLWLESDHYKWRLMRQAGIEEKYITGDADYIDKFICFARALEMSPGHPVYYFCHLELKELFDIDEPLCRENAAKVYAEMKEKLRRVGYRDIIKKFNVEYVATTDDPAIDLIYHENQTEKLMYPTFRADNAIFADREYVEKIGLSGGRKIKTLDDYKSVLTDRLDYFCKVGCVLADQSMASLPSINSEDKAAGEIFKNLGNADAKDRDFLAGNILEFLCGQYKERDMTMQLHLCTLRNVNSTMFEKAGRDSGFDCMNDCVSAGALAGFLDRLEKNGKLPSTIIYSLNPEGERMINVTSGAFKNVRSGPSWWFNDTDCMIRRQLKIVKEYSSLGRFPGMLTDSRSPSAYVRFDFFRRILCDEVGSLVDEGLYDKKSALSLVRAVCYENAKNIVKKDT